MLINFTNPDVPIITPELEDFWSTTDDIECERAISDYISDEEERTEIHHLRYKEKY